MAGLLSPSPASSSSSLSPAAQAAAAASAASPWVYFLAGAVLPTVAWFFLRQRPSSSVERAAPKYDDDEDEEDDYEDEDDDDGSGGNNPQELSSSSSPSSRWGASDAPYKMVLCVNQSLPMTKGKVAAQCGHATLGAYKRAMKHCPHAVRWWERTGCAKIAVKCMTEQEMLSVADAAASKNIPLYLVEDAGRTQIMAGSRTVLGLGPAPVHAFEGVTSHLKLL